MKRTMATTLILMFIILTGCSASGSRETSTSTVAARTPRQETGANTLTVKFGYDGDEFPLYLEENTTAYAILNYVGSSVWNLPIYSYDESEVMQYYDIPRYYEIPSNEEEVTAAKAGDVFYSDPNRIILYYHDAEINEEYTPLGHFEASDEFIRAVEENPVLQGWGNTLVIISRGQ